MSWARVVGEVTSITSSGLAPIRLDVERAAVVLPRLAHVHEDGQVGAVRLDSLDLPINANVVEHLDVVAAIQGNQHGALQVVAIRIVGTILHDEVLFLRMQDVLEGQRNLDLLHQPVLVLPPDEAPAEAEGVAFFSRLVGRDLFGGKLCRRAHAFRPSSSLNRLSCTASASV